MSANLWEGERDPYLDQVPPAHVPTYSAVFHGPLFETVVVSEPLFDESGVDGIVRWEAESTALSDTFDELGARAGRTRRVERL